MKEEVYFVKSLEEDFSTKTLKGRRKVIFQTIDNIIKSKVIKPNTLSFERKKRLSCTILHKSYLKTYRPQGIIFQTTQKPDYILPFDLVILSATDKIITHNYNNKLIPNFEQFIFENFDKMIKEYSSPEKVWKAVNNFRIKKGYKPLKKQEYKLIEYNEAIFHKPVKIKPIAIFGYTKQAKIIAKRINLPHYISARKFYESLRNK